jgi:retron-type reverse transcriptase
MMGLYEMIDEAIAFELEVDVETYVDVIENKCTLEEADAIIDIVWKQGDIEEAKRLFNQAQNKE